MPIQGLTTTTVSIPPVIGQLRKGGEKEKRRKDGKEYEVFGKDLDYFRFTPRNEQDAELLAAFVAGYGEAPKRLDNIYLPGPEVDDNLMAFCEEYNAATLLHRCDGVWIYERDRYTGQLVPTNAYCPYAEENPQRRDRPRDGGCKQRGRLAILLPALVEAGYYGTVSVLTHSINDIARLYQSLANYRERFGPLNRYPLTLYRATEAISTPNGDKRARRDKSLLNIMPSNEFVLKQFEAVRRAALAAPAEPKRLVVDRSTGEVIEGIATSLDDPDALQEAIQQYNTLARKAVDAGVADVPRLTKADDLQVIRSKGAKLAALTMAFAGDLYNSIEVPEVVFPDEGEPLEIWIEMIEEMQGIIALAAKEEVQA